MRFAVRPRDGVGAVRFGMTREAVRTRLGEPDGEGDWPESGESEDEWSEDGLAVVYDADGRCVEVALFAPAAASLSGIALLGADDGDARETLLRLDSKCEEQDGVLVSAALGLLLLEDDDGDLELVAVAPGRLDTLAQTDGGEGDAA